MSVVEYELVRYSRDLIVAIKTINDCFCMDGVGHSCWGNQMYPRGTSQLAKRKLLTNKCYTLSNALNMTRQRICHHRDPRLTCLKQYGSMFLNKLNSSRLSSGLKKVFSCSFNWKQSRTWRAEWGVVPSPTGQSTSLVFKKYLIWTLFVIALSQWDLNSHYSEASDSYIAELSGTSRFGFWKH